MVTPPPLETEKGNTFWHLAGTKDPLLIGFWECPDKGKFCWGSVAKAQCFQLGAQNLTISPFHKGGGFRILLIYIG